MAALIKCHDKSNNINKYYLENSVVLYTVPPTKNGRFLISGSAGVANVRKPTLISL